MTYQQIIAENQAIKSAIVNSRADFPFMLKVADEIKEREELHDYLAGCIREWVAYHSEDAWIALEMIKAAEGLT